MLANTYRFHGHGSLRYVYKNGTVSRSHSITMKSSRNPRRSKPRIAVVVSKKVIKSAVKRNRIRRRLYEQLRVQIRYLEPDRDIVCIVTSAEVGTIAAEAVKAQLDGLIRQSGLYKSV